MNTTNGQKAMKFKDFLTEQASYFKGIEEMLATQRLPITSKVAKLLGFDNIEKEVYHCTTIEHLNDMKKLQNSKKHISCFTKGLSSLLDKIVVKPDVMFKLKGNVVMSFNHDIFSHPDKYGRRWINTRGHNKSDFLQRVMITKVLKKICEYVNEEYTDELMYDSTSIKYYFEQLSKKQKQEVVQMYFDKVHELLKNNIYTKIVKEIIAVPQLKANYDELIVNKFKIIGCYAIQNGKFMYNHDNAKSIIEDAGIKYLGFIEQHEFTSI